MWATTDPLREATGYGRMRRAGGATRRLVAAATSFRRTFLLPCSPTPPGAVCFSLVLRVRIAVVPWNLIYVQQSISLCCVGRPLVTSDAPPSSLAPPRVTAPSHCRLCAGSHRAERDGVRSGSEDQVRIRNFICLLFHLSSVRSSSVFPRVRLRVRRRIRPQGPEVLSRGGLGQGRRDERVRRGEHTPPHPQQHLILPLTPCCISLK